MEKYVLSKYNVFKIINDETVVGVNLNKQMLFAIEMNKYLKLEKYKLDIALLKKEDLVFFTAMFKLGIIEDQKRDNSTYNSLLLNNRIISFHSPNYRLTINPTLNCNFSCWYCYEQHTKKMMSKEIIESTLRYIDNLLDQNKFERFYLDWFGGEPLLAYKKVMKIIAPYAKKKCEEKNVIFESGITTNGFLINPDVVDFFKEINMQSLQITLDGEKKYHDNIRFPKSKNISSYDRIVENIILLADKINPYNLALRINFTKETFNGLENIANSFPIEFRHKITILLQQVWQDKDKGNVPLEEVEALRYYFSESGFKVDKNILNIKCYTCYADLFNQALINYDGRVFKCTARNFEKEKEDGILTEDGDIIWSETIYPMKVIKATFENRKCMNCKYLPVCFGPCSQKISTVKNTRDFDKYCFKGGIENTLNYIMTEFEKSGKVLTHILNYR